MMLPLSSRWRRRRATFLVGSIAWFLTACATDAPLAVRPPDVDVPVAPTTQGRARAFPEAYPDAGEVRQGFVIGRDGRPMAISYEVHDGLALWQGDIVLGRADDISSTREGARPFFRLDPAEFAPVAGESVRPSIYINGAGYRWPGGVMPYEVDPALAADARIPAAIALIENTTGGVDLVPRNGQADYVRIIPDSICLSPIGRQGGQQIIRISMGCPAGSLAHEMLHSLGLFHEQSMCERDTYVEVLPENIFDAREGNFNKECSLGTDLPPYDFGSIMHYPLDAFSENGQPTMRLRPGISYVGEIGQRDSLSFGDRFAMNYLYGLNNKPPVPIIAPFLAWYDEGDAVPMDGTGSTDADDTFLSYRWNFGDNSCGGLPEPPECRLGKGTHRYANDGVYKVGLFVYDGYEEKATEAYVTIRNVKPIVAIAGTQTLDEGDRFQSQRFFIDPGADYWSATVDYGDGGGQQALPLSGSNFDLDHVYVDDGTFTLSVDVTDDDETGTSSYTMLVRNAAPVVNAGADQRLESGQSFDFAGSFSDRGVLDSPWNWSLAWGFGAPTTGSASAQGTIAASRRMCTTGTFDVVFSVTDKDGGIGRDTARVTVGYVAVGMDATPGSTPNAISMRNRGDWPVAILSSATFDARTLDVSTIRLGDENGTDTPVARAKGQYRVQVQDVNGDGLTDLMLFFSVPQLVSNGDLAIGRTSLAIRGVQGASQGSCVNVRGTDSIVVVS